MALSQNKAENGGRLLRDVLWPIRRVSASVEIRAMRAKSAVKQWLHERHTRPVAWRASSDVELCFLVGLRHVPMFAVALRSLALCEPEVPRLRVAADSSEALTALAAVLPPPGGDVTLVSWDERLGLVPQRYRGFIDRYLATPRWDGFGKKFALLLALNTDRDVLYSDADVLWYSPVIRDVLDRTAASGAGLCIGSDFQESFDNGLLTFLDYRFTTPVPMNTGFLGMRREALLAALDVPRIARWHDYQGPLGCHTEQTVIACAADSVGAAVLPAELVGVSMADFGRFHRQFTPRVRHYAGPKTLFWRDC